VVNVELLDGVFQVLLSDFAEPVVTERDSQHPHVVYLRQYVQLECAVLAAAYRDGGERQARENMLYASSLAGIAISNSCTGLAHSLDHTGIFHFFPQTAPVTD